MLEPPGIKGRERRGRIKTNDQRQWSAKKLTVVALQAAPQAGVHMDILAKSHQRCSQFAHRLSGPNHGAIRKAALDLLQQAAQVLGEVGEVFVRSPRWKRRTVVADGGSRGTHSVAQSYRLRPDTETEMAPSATTPFRLARRGAIRKAVMTQEGWAGKEATERPFHHFGGGLEPQPSPEQRQCCPVPSLPEFIIRPFATRSPRSVTRR